MFVYIVFQAHELYVSQVYSVAVLEDVRCVVEGPNKRAPLTYIMAALSDLHALLTNARKHASRGEYKIQKLIVR